MKKKILILSILLLGCYYWYSFTSKDHKYEILNEIIRDDELMLSEICAQSIKIEVFENNLSSFTFFEQLSVNFQKLTQTTPEIEEDKVKYFNRRLKKAEFSNILTNCNEADGIFYMISMPIVSPDKQTVLIKITEACNCLLGGQSGTYIYKKVNGKWMRTNMISGWIS